MITKPKEIISYLRESRTLRKIADGSITFQRRDFERFLKFCQSAKKKGKQSKEYRKFMCKVALQLRKNFEYKPEDFSKAKEAYEAFVAEGGITSFEQLNIGDWVTCIRNMEAPVKGDTYASYYMNGNSAGNIGEAYKIVKFYDSIETLGCRDEDYNDDGLILGQFRMSTQEEIDAKDGLVYKRKLKKINDYTHTKVKQIIELNQERKELNEKYNK